MAEDGNKQSTPIEKPKLVEKDIIEELGQPLQPLAQDKRLQNIDHTITLVDGSLIAALPRIMEASFRKAKTGSGMVKWRLHTHFELLRGVPTRIDVTPDGGGPYDKRAMLEATLEADRLYVTDRGYAKFALFNKIAGRLKFFSDFSSTCWDADIC